MRHHHGGGALGAFVIIAAIAYAFGPRVAKIAVGTVLIAVTLFFAYVMFRVVMGTI